MNKFIQAILSFSLKNKYFIFFLTAVAIIAGFISYSNTPIEAFPDVTNTRIVIITQWPGRSAEEVEKFISIPMEVELNAVPKKTSLRSISLFGLSVISVIFDDDVEDMFARQYVANLLVNVDFPDGVNAEIQPPYGPTGEIYRYTLRSTARSVRELKTIQDWVIERQLKSVPGVADVVSFGGEVRTFEISVDPNELVKYNITPLQVYDAVARSNVNVGGDVIERNGQAIVVRGIGILNNIAEIENITVANAADGTPVLVKNLADVHESALPRLGQVGRDKVPDVVEGIIVMRKAENPSKVLEGVKAKIEELNTLILPQDVSINTFYDRTDLISHTTHTVLHNLAVGIILVTVVVMLFMGELRTTLCVAIIIPLSLLFAFICMRIKGMSANLLSMGAIDFGIIIDGAVVMVEGMFVALDHLSSKVGMERYNKRAKGGLLKRTGSGIGKSIFFSQLIMISALLPIFAFQKVEGKMFSPLAWTLGFALLGALLFTLTLVPAMVSLLLNKNVKEKHNRLVEGMRSLYMRAFTFVHHHKRISLFLAMAALGGGLLGFTFLGTEFLPHLNEGAIYIRASLPISISLPESVRLTQNMRRAMAAFPEVRQVLSQTGRPNDGTDPTGFFNVEFHVDIYPQEEWKARENTGHTLSKDELIAEMQAKLANYPGVNFNFSQPITDNVEEAVSGVKGSLAVKIYGPDIEFISEKADSVYSILKNINGVEDLGVVPNLGQPELRIELDEYKKSLYGVTTADAQAVIEMAIGGKTATYLYEGERKFGIRLRYLPAYRTTVEDVNRLLVPTSSGTKVPVSEIAKVSMIMGPAFIYRENNTRFAAVKFSVRGRDLGSTIAEGQAKVGKAIHLPKGYRLAWQGEFENQERATKTLSRIVPVSLLIIFLLLFVTFGNARDSILVLMTVPFALVGGIMSLLLTGVNFSISAGVGFIAVFGVCVQNGVLLISEFKHNLMNRMPLGQAIFHGVEQRVRPVVMTALIAILGLMPAAVSTGIGSETQKPLAVVVIGGLITSNLMILLILPLFFETVYKRISTD